MGRTCDGPKCDKPAKPRSKYCSRNCCAARSRANRRQAASGRTPGTLVTDEAERAAQELLREELRPHVREAITEEVLRGIVQLIGHVPAAVEKAAAALNSPDEEVRLKAATLILRHSAGNKAIVPDINEDKQRELNVFFNLPRPDRLEVIEGAATTEKVCDSCGETKPPPEFVGNSDRCTVCFERIREAARELTDSAAS